MPGIDFDDETWKKYENAPHLSEIGVYTKHDTLLHKIEMVSRLLKNLAKEGKGVYEEAINDDGETYTGVFWKIPFNYAFMSLEETLDFKYGIDSHDSVSTPMRIGYNGELKRIWFASSKQWLGYFDVEFVQGNDVYIEKWHPLECPEDYPRKPFQGFTYKVPATDARQNACTLNGVCNFQRTWHHLCCSNPDECEHKKKTDFDPLAHPGFTIVEDGDE